MFGISWAEFCVILIVAALVIPARMWPDVIRFLARIVKFVRGIMWRIADASEQIKQTIDMEQPIDELLRTTTADIMADFTTPINQISKSNTGKRKKIQPKTKNKTSKQQGGKNK